MEILLDRWFEFAGLTCSFIFFLFILNFVESVFYVLYGQQGQETVFLKD